MATSDENGHACIRERLPPVEVDACVSQRGGRLCVLRHLVPEVKLTSSGGGVDEVIAPTPQLVLHI